MRRLPEYESTHVHEPYLIQESAHGEHDLTRKDERGEDNRAETNTKDAIDEEATEKAEYDVGPAVPAVEGCERGGRDLQVFFEVVLESGRSVVAKVRAEAEQTHEDERKVAEEELARIANATGEALGWAIIRILNDRLGFGDIRRHFIFYLFVY